jgi:L-threonylcarbamoyladenylate synthase
VSPVDDVVAAIHAGGLAVIPTDTVYGLACTPHDEGAVRALSEVKGRPPTQPIALVAANVDALLECMPELRGRPAEVARALLPGPYTLVLPNPARRFPWLVGERREAIGVRVPDVAGAALDVLERVGAVAATSANHHGGADPRVLADVPLDMLARAVALDGGELPGVPSTVVDVTTAAPRVLREGAVPAAAALARIESVLAE